MSGPEDLHEGQRCALCLSLVARPAFRRGGATWWKCKRCGLYFVHPQPEPAALDELYRSTYYEPPGDDSPAGLAKWERRVRTIETACPPCRVLDVGCGRGEFMRASLAHGWDAWGLEVAAGALGRLPGSLSGRVAVGRLEDPPFGDGSFGAVTCFDVIEHVHRPVEFLRHARRLLEPGGFLIITTPNAATLKARLRRRYWKYFDFERYLHLYHFSPSTLELTLRRSGFEVAVWLRRAGMPLWVAARRDMSLAGPPTTSAI